MSARRPRPVAALGPREIPARLGRLGFRVGAALTLLVGLTSPVVARSSGHDGDATTQETTLVQYGFDQRTPTGPDTVRVFQNASGHVRLQSAYRVSGYGAVELRDVPGDGDFPELQGYFPKTRKGHLYLQFAIMIPDASQELNIALAGPRGFRLSRDGIAFWLSTRDEWLFHTSDSIPKRLFEVEPFTWYHLTVDYDVEAGRYHLWAVREGEREPFLTRLDQPNAARQGASAVSLFSFIGDNGDDLSAAVYYVDDVLVARSRPAELGRFVAPARRRFFVDLFTERPADLLKSCHPVQALEEIGIRRTAEMTEADWRTLERWLDDKAAFGAVGPALGIALRWRQGCDALATGQFQDALSSFDDGLRRDPDALALVLGRGLALAGLGRFAELDRSLDGLADLGADPRLQHLHAVAIAGTRDLATAVAWLEGPARGALLAGEPSAMADAYFTLLRLDGRWSAAFDYAHSMAGLFARQSADASLWFERAGQAAFADRQLDDARRAFESARLGADSSRPDLALADIAWLEGDVERERKLRENIYGRLDF
ncbi:MAG: hypothetical protein AAGM22_32480 [Acidobacteriota bacterium]